MASIIVMHLICTDQEREKGAGGERKEEEDDEDDTQETDQVERNK